VDDNQERKNSFTVFETRKPSNTASADLQTANKKRKSAKCFVIALFLSGFRINMPILLSAECEIHSVLSIGERNVGTPFNCK
jgi:hypothetical protein